MGLKGATAPGRGRVRRRRVRRSARENPRRRSIASPAGRRPCSVS